MLEHEKSLTTFPSKLLSGLFGVNTSYADRLGTRALPNWVYESAIVVIVAVVLDAVSMGEGTLRGLPPALGTSAAGRLILGAPASLASRSSQLPEEAAREAGHGTWMLCPCSTSTSTTGARSRVSRLMLTRRSERPVEFVGLNAKAGAFRSVGEEAVDDDSGCAMASASTIDPRPRSLLRALNLHGVV